MKILVASGPTREPIDPVRYISNRSTGVLGLAIVQEARRRGHAVTLVTGPTGLDTPGGVRVRHVETARQMQAALRREFRRSDALIMAAAVADFRPIKVAARKIKRGTSPKKWTLTLAPNPDIIAGLGRVKRATQAIVGFALETENGLRNARAKLKQKRLDAVVLTQLDTKRVPFGRQWISGAVVRRSGKVLPFHRVSKQVLARQIVDVVEQKNMHHMAR